MGRNRKFDGVWPPAEKPANFEFSLHAKGWAKWYRGSSRVIAVRSLDRGLVRRTWDERKRQIDAALDAEAVAIRKVVAGQTSLADAACHFFNYLDHRVAHGKPEPLAWVTAEDYIRAVDAFCRSAGVDRPLGTLTQQDFSRHAAELAEFAPSTVYRTVAYLQAWFGYCRDEGLIAELPSYGRMFRKPSAQTRRDVRLSVEKSYDGRQVRELHAAARPDERLWIVLGLCGALDNADVAHLTRDVLDREAGVIDYRRRKRGKVRRVIPMPPAFWAALDRYRRPPAADPADEDRVFLTPEGHALARKATSASGKVYSIDYVSMRWTRLMIATGLRPPMPSRRVKAHRELERRTKGRGSADGAGFRGLRTTFPNMAPPGYRDEVEIVMGHSHGKVLLDNYLEKVGVGRLRELVDAVYREGLAAELPLPWAAAAAAAVTPPAAAGGATPPPGPADARPTPTAPPPPA